jgi:hypothetical protein
MSENRHNPEFLYNAYKNYSENQGQKPISQKRFGNLLIDLCQVQLGWSDVQKGRDRRGRYIIGLALRPDGDFSPFPITEELGSVTDKPVTVTDSVTAETTAVYGCDGCDGFLEDVSRTHNIVAEVVSENFSPVNDLKNDPQPVTPVTPVTGDTQNNQQVWEEFSRNYKPYPNPKSDNELASQKRVSKIRQAVQGAQTKEDLSALRRDNGGEFSFEELKWVQNFLKSFFPIEYAHLMAVKEISQPSLL